MDTKKINQALSEIGGLEYIVNVHISDTDLQSRLLRHIKALELLLSNNPTSTSRCPRCGHLMADDEPFCLSCDHLEPDINDQARRDYEDIYGKEEE